MNIAPAHAAPPVNTKLVALLEKKLADAKAGRLVGAAVIGAYAPAGLTVETEGEAMPLQIGAVRLMLQLDGLMFPGASTPVQSAPVPGSRRFSS